MLPWLIFEVGTIWFWMLLVAATVIMVACVEYASPGWAVITLIGFFLVLPRATTLAWLHGLKEHPSLIVLLAAGYVVVGTVWSIVKWWFFVRNKAHAYFEAEREYRQRKGLPATGTVTPSSYQLESLAQRPSADREKRRILTWMIYWPWSAVWTALDEPIKKAFKMIFKEIRGLYEKISARAFKDIPPLP